MRTTLILLAAAVAGCNATMPQQQARPTARDDPSNPCFQSIPTAAALEPIAGKIPLGNPRAASLEMLSSQERPNEAEKAALSQWAKMRSDCTEAGRQFRATYAPPGWQIAFDEGQVGVTQAIAALYAGGTYGQFNTERQKLAVQIAAKLDASSRAGRQADIDHAAAQRAASLQSLQTMQLLQAMQPRPLPMPMPPQSVICTSRPGPGGTATTVCQ